MTASQDAPGSARAYSRSGIRSGLAALALTFAVGSAQAQIPAADPSRPIPQPPLEETAAARQEGNTRTTERTRQSRSADNRRETAEAAAISGDPSQPIRQAPLKPAAGNDRAETAENNVQLAALPGVRAKMPSCVPSALVATIRKIEQDFGPVEVISTFRKGAVVAGSGRPSKHAACRAVDFRPARGTYRQVANWLKANHDGGVGTYSGHHNHIHIDNGGRYRWHN